MICKLVGKRFVAVAAAFLFAVFFITPNGNRVCAKNTPDKIQNTQNTLTVIDKYQTKYFTIVKRNDVFLNLENSKELNKDRKELKKLFKNVEKQISSKSYLKEYKEIEKRYSKCEAQTTIEINEFAQKNYDEVDNLLNKVYKEVKTKISSEDFKNLTASEKKWLKEVENYEKVYNSKEFGTIGTSVYYTYQINMREFRTLLLMLYL